MKISIKARTAPDKAAYTAHCDARIVSQAAYTALPDAGTATEASNRHMLKDQKND